MDNSKKTKSISKQLLVNLDEIYMALLKKKWLTRIGCH